MNYSGKVQPTPHCSTDSLVKTIDDYKSIYAKSIKDPAGFWHNIATNDFHWYTQPSLENTLNYNFNLDKGRIFIEWFRDGVTNICYNSVDRNIDRGLGPKTAFLWEGNEPSDSKSITYQDLFERVNAMAKVLLDNGVKKGSKVVLYLPMIIELSVAMLACSRIGAIHVVVFAGFSSAALAERIQDVDCTHVICADAFKRGKKLVETKKIVDEALEICSRKGYTKFERCLIYQYQTSNESLGILKKDCDLIINSSLAANKSALVDCVKMAAEDQLFILYTSGSTGKPKGIVHTTGGYMIYSATTTKYVFDFDTKTPSGDLIFCTADIGWITGHSYVVYGPLLNGGTSVIFEGIPTYPNVSRYWDIIQKYRVSKFYTSPTALRSLIQYGEEPIAGRDLSSLKVLGTVGEAIDQTSWNWFYRVIGQNRCSIVDTYWQTETGGHMLTPLPGCIPMKPGSATFPFFGIDASVETDKVWREMHNCLIDDSEQERSMMADQNMKEGCLVFRAPWPGIMRSIYGDHERFESTYFSRFRGCYITGDSARIENEYFWIVGRIDDMLNISGHLLSTLEVEGTMTKDPNVMEAAVVARPHKIKGECLHCFIVGNDSLSKAQIQQDLIARVRKEIGPFAQPSYIQFVDALPKTRSGKVMRRVLRKIADGSNNFGDLSTLINPECIPGIVEGCERDR